MLFERGWDFRVNDSSSCSHPLNISWSYFSFMPFKVFVKELSLEHVGDCFKATVGVVREPSWKFYFKEVKHEEGVKIP